MHEDEMPKERSVGVSEFTASKQEQYRKILGVHMLVSEKAAKKHDIPLYYYLFDMTAGTGYSKGEPGSALIAPRVAHGTGLTLRAWFFEQDAEAANELRANLKGEHGDLKVIEGDHSEGLPQVAALHGSIRGWRFGLVYWDGNADVRLPVAAIRSITQTRCFKPVDVLTYVAATARKRVIGKGLEAPRLLDDLEAIGKRYIWVREPQGDWQWTFALLTNWADLPDFKRDRFYRTDTPKGQAIMERLNWTTRELKGRYQPVLPL
jgi:hypothetical protein